MKNVIIKIVNLFMILVVLFSINNICFGIRLVESNTVYNENIVSDKIFSNGKNENQIQNKNSEISVKTQNNNSAYIENAEEKSVKWFIVELIQNFISRVIIIGVILENLSAIYKNDKIKKLKNFNSLLIMSIILGSISVVISLFLGRFKGWIITTGIIPFLILITILIITELKKKNLKIKNIMNNIKSKYVGKNKMSKKNIIEKIINLFNILCMFILLIFSIITIYLGVKKFIVINITSNNLINIESEYLVENFGKEMHNFFNVEAGESIAIALRILLCVLIPSVIYISIIFSSMIDNISIKYKFDKNKNMNVIILLIISIIFMIVLNINGVGEYTYGITMILPYIFGIMLIKIAKNFFENDYEYLEENSRKDISKNNRWIIISLIMLLNNIWIILF